MNWKALIAIAQIAMNAHTRFPTVHFIIALLKQFDRSIIHADNSNGPRQSGRAGFVYAIRDKANGERFKIGHRAKPPWRDSQLRSQMGQSQDFVLIIPAKDASALEKKLRRAYAKGSMRGEWFTLNESERREILIIAALVMTVAGESLGMSPVDDEVVNLAKRLLTHLKRLATAMWTSWETAHQQPSEDVGANDSETDLDKFSAIPDFDWNWESVLNKDYQALPKLKGKEAYLSVIRDNDAKQGKVFLDSHPVNSIEAAFLERSLRFPLEIDLILKVDNKKKVRAELLSPTERKNATEWVNLFDEELGAIRNAASKGWKHRGVYISPKTHWGLETLTCDAYKDYPEIEKPAGYVCLVQGVKPGKLRKIWETLHPKGLAGDIRLALMLNNPHDVHTATEPIQFKCIIKAEHAKSFQTFLRQRYAVCETGGWFKLTDAQLQEIRDMGT